MNLNHHKTKIVATIGPASRERATLERMIRAGMNVARLNFSHGSFDEHAGVISEIRAAAEGVQRRVAIMADLPGPKMRIGEMPGGPIKLLAGDTFTLTSDDCVGTATRVSMSFEPLPRVVAPGDRLFLNDGLVQLTVDAVAGNDVICTVAVGGPVSSRKGLNLPRIALGISAFTDHDRECLEFAIAHGVDAVSQSFVESAKDIVAVRDAAAACGRVPFIIAKIERVEAVERYDEILEASDGIMVARGDLGVEVPIHDMAAIQKRLIAGANMAGKPVITATQMLESMTSSRLPTRAEATDVANAILDGTDCIMLSGESAMGAYPVESIEMLASISRSAEEFRKTSHIPMPWKSIAEDSHAAIGRAKLFDSAIKITECDAALVPTRSGRTARVVARWRPDVWIFAVGPDPAAMQGLAFSYGVFPLDVPEDPDCWDTYARELNARLDLGCETMLLAAGPSERNPHSNDRIELIPMQQRSDSGIFENIF